MTLTGKRKTKHDPALENTDMRLSSRQNRRDFLRTGAAATAGLVIGFHFTGQGITASRSQGDAFMPNAFVRIGPDDSVTIIVNKSEMGQGVYTALPMILAEELDADWSKVRVEAAPVAPEYAHVFFGIQMTGASTSVISSWEQLRKAGASARAMFVAAAAETWGVDSAGCLTERGFVIHKESKRRLSYGALAEKAAKMRPPTTVALKDERDFQIIGKPLHRLDTREKVTGRAEFGMDAKRPGMAVALVARSPVFGGKVKSFDAKRALGVAGVRQVTEIGSGVAVVADGFWAAKKGREALDVEWDGGPLSFFDSAAEKEHFKELAEKPGIAARKDGDAVAALAGAASKLHAIYDVPYLAHATMEPLNCVADVRPDGCDVWVGTQMQSVDRDAAAQVSGLKPEQVRIHTLYLGGGFGRRACPTSHFVREAVELSKKLQFPVKVIWTREDDMHSGYYRPAYLHKMYAGLTSDGNLVAWGHRIVGRSILAGTIFEAHIKDGVDETSVQGAVELPYRIPATSIDLQSVAGGIPVLWWRSVGHSHTAFAVESFIDEIAHSLKRDPVEFRLSLLDQKSRYVEVLKTAAGAANWGKELPAGRARGVAVHESFGTCVAHVVEVQLKAGEIKVERVTSAIDCGRIVNPAIIKAQIESAIIFGLSAALRGQITMKKGRVQQTNFHDYKVIRMSQTPQMEVHLAAGKGPQGGIGEPGVPPIAPALCNAIFSATGKRIRRLPVDEEGIRIS